MPDPDRLTLRMYNVGFGDCFLLSLHYPHPLDDGRKQRHVLIDFGSTSKGTGLSLDQTGRLIEQHCAGKLDVVVVTHRHKDHLQGFDGEGALIAQLAPDLVVRSWTEHPDAANGGTAEMRGFAAALDAADAFMERVAAELAAFGPTSLQGSIAAAAADAVKNKEAVRRLAELSQGGKGEYLFAGEPTRIPQVVPGLGVEVLGPPTPNQHPEIVRQREDDAEYWLRLGAAFSREIDAALRTEAAGTDDSSRPPGPVDWLIQKMDRQQLHHVRRVVTEFDDALNNTSLLLLFTVGSHKMLFPGDAQIENWQYTTQSPDRLAGVADIDLYKVGHHGSRNGTPRSVVGLWKSHNTANPGRLLALMSTKAGVHGTPGEGTEVPRTTLVDALRSPASLGRLVSTEGDPPISHVEVTARTTRRGGYRVRTILR